MKTKPYQNWISATAMTLTVSLSLWPASAAQKVFALFGDCGEGNKTDGACSGWTTDADQVAVKNLMFSWNPDFFVTTGDNIYFVSNQSSYVGIDGIEAYDIAVGQYYHDYIKYPSGSASCFTSGQPSVNKFFPVVGNHDWDWERNTSDQKLNSLDAFTRYFDLPGAGVSSGTVSSGNERYYDFIQGDAHFFVISSDPARENYVNPPPASPAIAGHGVTAPAETSGTSTPDQTQQQQAYWLKQALAASTAKWKFVVFHHPPYSSASGSVAAEMKWPFQPWGADAVLVGHVHAYERIMHRVDGSSPRIPYITSGMGGRDAHTFSTTAADSIARLTNYFGAVRAAVNDRTASFVFYTAAGQMFDSILLVKQSGGGGTLDSTVATGSDDAEENAAGTTVDLTSSDLELVDDAGDLGNGQKVGIRFQNITVPKSAVIRKAYIQFAPKNTGAQPGGNGTTSLTIRGQAADNAATFVASANNISGRSVTTASASWNPTASWSTSVDTVPTPDQITPDLTSIVQEIVNRSGWASGNALATIITGSGMRRAYSYNGLSAGAPRLHIEWELFEITTQPQSLVVNAGSSAAFSVAATGSGTFSYQWRKDGVNISGAINSSYTISSAQCSDAGIYDVVVTSSGVSITSDAATLSVISTQPQAQIVNAGSSASFSVTVCSPATVSYQWRKGGANISQATSSSYPISSAQCSDAASYDVVVTASGASGTSQAADLGVISTQPQCQIVNGGTSPSVSVTVCGSGTFTYQWRLNANNISGANSSSYTITSIGSGNAGTYDVVVSKGGASATSASALVAAITTQPQNKIASVGNATFSVAIAPSGSYTYQWYHDGNAVSGATSSSLVVSSSSSANAGNYYAVAGKSGCSSGTSQSACFHIVTQLPQSAQVTVGNEACFHVVVAGSCGSLAYQWKKNLVNISGAVAPDYCIPNVASSDVASYRIYLTDGSATWNSSSVQLTTNANAVITTQPQSKSANPGNSVTFTVAASGTSPFTYQWWKDTTQISGATSSSLTLNNITTSDTASYSVVVNSVTAVPATSTPAVLTVVDKPAWELVSSSLGGSSLGSIFTHVEQPDGKILVGGSFGVVRLEADGSVDSSFSCGIPSGAGYAFSLALSPAGSIYVGGAFAWYDYDEENNPTTYYDNSLIRLNSDGSIDSSFWPQPSGNVYALAVQPDGNVIVGGEFESCATYSPTKRLTRLLGGYYGYVDSTFHEHNVGLDGPVRAVTLRSDGKIVAAGEFSYFDDGYYPGNTQTRLIQLNSDGTLDWHYYIIWLSGNAYSVAVQSDGKVLLGGTLTQNTYAGTYNGICRFTVNSYQNAILDTSFNAGAGANGSINSMVVNQSAFVATGSLNTERSSHVAALLPNGKVLVAGGWNLVDEILDSAELYNPANGTWTATTNPMNKKRVLHTATPLGNGKILIAGGYNFEDGTLDSAELYDPSNGTWTTTTNPMNDPRAGHTATLLADGRVLMVSGSTAEIFDPSDGSWTSTDNLNLGRSQHSATLLADGKVLVAGGFIGVSPFVLTNAEVFDPSDNSWTTINGMNEERLHHSATLLPNGKVLVASGTTSELYDPSDGSWTMSGDLNIFRDEHPALLLPNGKVLLVGGNGFWESVPTAEYYDPATGKWSTDGTLITARQAHTMTLLPNGKVLIAGGSDEDADHVYDSAELYEPESRIYVAGAFTTVDTVTRNGIARLKSDGTMDAYLNPGTGIGGTSPAIYTMSRSSDGTFIISGNFTSYNGTTKYGIARLKAR